MRLGATSHGFTLIELSVIIVILGLIITSVLSGRDLIRATELRSVTYDINQFKSAVNTFQLKYDLALPGDMPNATQYWAGLTANGNGDRRIVGAGTEEYLLAWQHLGLADLVKGDYTGQKLAGKDALNINVPISKIKGGGYVFYNEENYGRTDNFLSFGSINGNHLNGAIINAQEAWSIDNKMDDGLADAGMVIGLNAMSGGALLTTCTTGQSSDLVSDYILINDDIACRLIFWLQ